MNAFLTATLLALSAADDPQPGGTRVSVIERLRAEKSKRLEPDLPPRAEQILMRIERNPVFRALFENPSGPRLRIGGLVNGSGFAAGVEYFRPDLHAGDVVFRVGATGSMRLYQRYDALLAFPHLAADRMEFALTAVRRNYPSINYYGPGPDSVRSGRSNYRLEDNAFDARVVLKPWRPVRIGLTGGYLEVNVGPGTDRRFASTERVYSPVRTPGIDRQSNFLRFGPVFEFDYRDRSGDPHKGGYYAASYIYYDDRKLNTGSHRKFQAEAQQYIPFFNQKRVIALRGRTELSYRNANQVIPFYLQPTLGGGNDLRGFRPFRFYDNNLLLLNAEYRWEVMTGFDMAVFADSGKVFLRHSQLNFRSLEKSYGFGLRFSSRTTTFLRIDTGFSREGFQIWFKFNDFFGSNL